MITHIDSGYLNIFRPPYSENKQARSTIYCVGSRYSDVLMIIPLTNAFYMEALDFIKSNIAKQIYMIVPDIGVPFVSDYHNLYYEVKKVLEKDIYFVSASIPSIPINEDFRSAFIISEDNTFTLSVPRSETEEALIQIELIQLAKMAKEATGYDLPLIRASDRSAIYTGQLIQFENFETNKAAKVTIYGSDVPSVLTHCGKNLMNTTNLKFGWVDAVDSKSVLSNAHNIYIPAKTNITTSCKAVGIGNISNNGNVVITDIINYTKQIWKQAFYSNSNAALEIMTRRADSAVLTDRDIDLIKSNFMFEIGSTASTEVIPFNGQMYNVVNETLLTIPLKEGVNTFYTDNGAMMDIVIVDYEPEPPKPPEDQYTGALIQFDAAGYHESKIAKITTFGPTNSMVTRCGKNIINPNKLEIGWLDDPVNKGYLSTNPYIFIPNGQSLYTQCTYPPAGESLNDNRVVIYEIDPKLLYPWVNRYTAVRDNELQFVTRRYDREDLTDEDIIAIKETMYAEMGEIYTGYEPFIGDVFDIASGTTTEIPLIAGINTFYTDNGANMIITIEDIEPPLPETDIPPYGTNIKESITTDENGVIYLDDGSMIQTNYYQSDPLSTHSGQFIQFSNNFNNMSAKIKFYGDQETAILTHCGKNIINPDNFITGWINDKESKSYLSIYPYIYVPQGRILTGQCYAPFIGDMEDSDRIAIYRDNPKLLYSWKNLYIPNISSPIEFLTRRIDEDILTEDNIIEIKDHFMVETGPVKTEYERFSGSNYSVLKNTELTVPLYPGINTFYTDTGILMDIEIISNEEPEPPDPPTPEPTPYIIDTTYDILLSDTHSVKLFASSIDLLIAEYLLSDVGKGKYDELHMAFLKGTYEGMSYMDLIKTSSSAFKNFTFCNQFGSTEEYQYALSLNVKLGGKYGL